MNWEVGLLVDIPAEEYHRRELGVVSSHAAGEILISERHYRAWLEETDERRTPALNLGTAAHMALLEPELFARTYVVKPDFGDCRANARTGTTKEEGKANKLAKEAWEAANAGRKVVEEEDLQAIKRMSVSLGAHPEAGRLLSVGDSELTMRWRCPETDLRCKARIDWLVWDGDQPIIVDFKTCMRGGARRDVFARDARKFGYRRQNAHYVDGLVALGYEPTFIFIAAEKEAPYDVGAFTLESDALEDGRSDMREAKRRLADALATDTWPGASPGIQSIGLERWETRIHG